MLESFYLQIRLVHIVCVALSGSLFAVRGALRSAEYAIANHRALRLGSYMIDTALLVAAVVLTTILHQYPFVNGWLTAKVVLLVLYVGFGTLALKRGRTRRIRIIAFAAALLTYIFMIGVAVAHEPIGWLIRFR
jgi:uncharacterized membrane protein SirB2